LSKISKIRDAKSKEGIFVGPRITQLFEDKDFITKLNSTERIAWKVFHDFFRNFRGNEKAENCSEVVQELISPCSAMGYSMSLKPNFLHSHSDFFT
jgi:hypothetical protein